MKKTFIIILLIIVILTISGLTIYAIYCNKNIIISAITAIGTIGAVIVAIFRDKINDCINKIQLELEDNNFKELYFPEQKKWYFHLQIKNKNIKRYIKNCTVELIGIEKLKHQSKFEKISKFLSIPFQFPPSEECIKNVNFTDDRLIDFLMIDKKANKILPCLQYYYSNFDYDIPRKEKIRYNLKIKAKGYSSSKIYCYEIFWDGEFPEGDDKDISKHVKIVRI